MPVSRITDNIIAYRILKMLVTPFNETAAYKLGIIDSKGNILKKSSQLRTEEEKSAYTFLHRIVFRLKRIIEKLPTENKKFASYAAAYALVRECVDSDKEPINLETLFIESLSKEYDTTLVEEFFMSKKIIPFQLFIEETGVPANSATVTAGITGIGRTPDDVAVPPVNKLTSKSRLFRRKKLLPKPPL